MNAIIQDIMRPFGVTPRYAGFPMLVASVELYLEDPNRLSAVIDEIYKPAAKRCRCTSTRILWEAQWGRGMCRTIPANCKRRS